MTPPRPLACAVTLLLVLTAGVAGCGIFFEGDAGDTSSAATPDPTVPSGDTRPPETAAACDPAELAALATGCPAGSEPVFGEEAERRCRLQLASGDGYAVGEEVGFCRGDAPCRVACNQANPCDCGVDRVSADGVICTPCGLGDDCGNAVCDEGETAATCPVDCADPCTDGDQRCSGDTLQTCSGGTWSATACPDASPCQVLRAHRRAFCSAPAAARDDAWPNLAPSRLDGTDWRAFTHPRGQLRCASPVCLWRGFLDGGVASLVLADSPRRWNRLDHATAAFTDTDTTEAHPHPRRSAPCTLDATGHPVAPNADGSALPLERFVDATVPLDCQQLLALPEAERAHAALVVDTRHPILATWALPSGRLLHLRRYSAAGWSSAPTTALRASEDGSLVAQTLHADGAERTILWHVERGTFAAVLDEEPAELQAAGTLALVPRDGRLAVLDLRTGEARTPSADVTLLAFTPDGRHLLGTGPDPHGETRLLLLDPATVEPVHRFPMDGEGHFSPDGRWLVVGSAIFSDDPGPW